MRIDGAWFGENPLAVALLFDETSVAPFRTGFSATRCYATAPLVAAATAELRMRVGNAVSEPHRFAVEPHAAAPGRPGDATLALYAALDEYAALAAALGRGAATSLSFGGADLADAAAALDGARAAAQLGLREWLSWRELQQGVDLSPLATLTRSDEIVLACGALERTQAMTASVFGGGGAIAASLGIADVAGALFGGGMSGLLGSVARGVAEALFGALAKLLHEHGKVFEGIECLLKVYQPSVEVGVGAGVEASVDVGFSVGELVSGIAKFVDAIAQWLGVGTPGGAGDGGLQEAVARLEGKADRQGVDIGEIGQDVQRLGDDVARLEQKADRGEVAVQRVQEAADRLEGKADRLEAKGDLLGEATNRLEGKTDRAEAKADRLGETIGQIEAKADRQEQKSDRLEAKADAIGSAVARLEAKADRLETKSDRLETKADRLEQKADAAEAKLDRQETKSDRLEGKSDRQEVKLDTLGAAVRQVDDKVDRLEAKADRLEGKADRLEAKSDRHEGKLDRLEAKGDRAERKLDRIEIKLDRLVPLLRPYEATVASQSGGGTNVSALLAAVEQASDRVFVRVAPNVAAAGLDDPANYTPWIDFDRPPNARRLVEVSTDLHYVEGSATRLEGQLSVRDAAGNVFVRAFEREAQTRLRTPARWSPWAAGFGSPP